MKTHPLNLREVGNKPCKRCGSLKRKEVVEGGLCSEVVSQLDGLKVRCVGGWAYDKIYWLVRYFDIFAQGMKSKWEGLNYIEICSGPGRCVIRDDGREIDGTALAIINRPIFVLLRKALFIDNSEPVIDILTKRIGALNASNKASATLGDYTDPNSVATLLSTLPTGCLNLCFIDPTHCDVPFKTIENIVKTLRKVDFIINVALGTDLTRNAPSAILDPSFAKARRKYGSFLGNESFFDRDDVRAWATQGKHEDLRRVFVEEYRQRLKRLGFGYTDARPVKHYYHLLFASGNPKGLEFWTKACEIGPDNQREMAFGEG